MSAQPYIVIYDGKKVKTYSSEILSNKSAKPLQEFKIKLIGAKLYPSYDCKAIFGLDKKFNVVELDPLTGKTSIRMEDIRKTFDRYDLILEEAEDFKGITSSRNGNCVAVIGWSGILVDKKGTIDMVERIEYRKRFTTEKYIRTEVDKWGAERIITEEEEHFYTEKAHIDSGAISPDCKNVALTESSLFERCYAAVYSLEAKKYNILRDVPYEEPLYEDVVWSRDSKIMCFFYRDKEFHFGIELFNLKGKSSQRFSLEFPIGGYDSSPMKQEFALYSFSGEILILDASKKVPSLKKLVAIGENPISLKYSPCGKYLLAVNKKRIHIIDLNGKILTSLKGKFATWFAVK